MVRSYVQKTRTKFKEQAAARKAAKEQERRRKILQDPSSLYEHRHEFTKQEIDDAINRYSTENRLKDVVNEQNLRAVRRGREVVNETLNLVKTMTQAYNLYQNAKGRPEKAISIDTDGSFQKRVREAELKLNKRNSNDDSSSNNGDKPKGKPAKRHYEEDDNKDSTPETKQKKGIDLGKPKDSTPETKSEKKKQTKEYTDYGKVHDGSIIDDIADKADEEERKKNRRK